MVRNGDAAKQVMITEGGWNDHPRWTKAVRPAQRVAYTIRAYEIVQGEWPWVDALCMWAFRYPQAGCHLPGLLHFCGRRFPPEADLR